MLLHQRHYALVLRLDRRHRLNTSLRCRQSPGPVHLRRRCQIRREQVPCPGPSQANRASDAEGGLATAAASWTIEGEEDGFLLYQPGVLLELM